MERLPNVKEHATPLAGAGVETGVEVHITSDVADKAASGGCCVSTCCASYFWVVFAFRWEDVIRAVVAGEKIHVPKIESLSPTILPSSVQAMYRVFYPDLADALESGIKPHSLTAYLACLLSQRDPACNPWPNREDLSQYTNRLRHAQPTPFPVESIWAIARLRGIRAGRLAGIPGSDLGDNQRAPHRIHSAPDTSERSVQKDSSFLHNVKEHAPLSAEASVDHGVEVETTEEHRNRAADRGCCGSSCSPLGLLGNFQLD